MGKQFNRTSTEHVGLRYPINAQIEVTEDCNHKCFYCYNYWREDDPKNNKMSLETADKLMDIVFDDIKPLDVTITGGEPLMNMDTTLLIAQRLRERNAPTSLNTNLALMTPDRVEQFRETNPNMGMLVSLPSINDKYFSEIVGARTMDKVLRNLENVVNSGYAPTVNMVVHKMNKDDVYTQGKTLHEKYGIQSFAMTPALRPAFRPDSGYHLDQDETISVLRDLVKLREDTGMKINALEVIPYCVLPEDLRFDKTFRRSCGAGRGTIQIGYDGKVRTCGHSPFTEGNVLEKPFEEIWAGLNAFRQNKYVPDECQECFEVDSCNGGCRYEGLQDGDLKNKKDSRMAEPLRVAMPRPKLEEIEPETRYQVELFGTRKEGEDSYLLYNGDLLLVNTQMKDFVDAIRSSGFKLNDFPSQYREKAETFGRVLKSKGFLK